MDRPGTVRRKPDGKYVAIRVHGGPCGVAHWLLVSTFTGASSVIPIADARAQTIYEHWPIVHAESMR